MLACVPVTDKRTQIYLTAVQHGAVQRIARRRGVSMACVCRDAIDLYLSTTPPVASAAPDPLADLAGVFEGPGDLSTHHDDYLYGPRSVTGRRRKR
jgi:hypothetical protein